MKLPESQSKALEEAAEEYSSLTSPSFIAGAHYQHQISYAQGIRDVIKFLRIGDWHGLCDQIESLFSAQLKTLETGNDEQRSGE